MCSIKLSLAVIYVLVPVLSRMVMLDLRQPNMNHLVPVMSFRCIVWGVTGIEKRSDKRFEDSGEKFFTSFMC